MKYLLFDLDGTLMDFHKGEKKAFCDTMEKFTGIVPSDSFCLLFKDINERLFNEFSKGLMQRIEFQERRFLEIAELMGVSLNSRNANKYYIESLKYQADLYPDVAETLEYLYPKYELYIASNGMDAVQRKRLSLAGIDSYFKDVFISEAFGYHKPDVRFFECIFEKIGNKDKNEYAIIGDRLDTDVLGGQNAGIHTFYLSRDKKEENSIASLKELLSIL